MKTVKMLTILALVTMVCLNEVSEASFLDDFENPGSVSYTGSNSYGSGGSYTVADGKLRITTGFDNTYSVMTTNTVVFNVGDTLSLDVPAISGTGSVFMMCSTSAFQPNGSTTFGFRFRRDGPGYARMELCPGGILTPYPLDPSPDKPAILMVKRTSDTGFLYLIKIEGEVTNLGSFTLPQLSGIIDLHIGAQAYRQIMGTTFAFDNLQVYKSPNFTDITVLTYNTHLFEDSPLECIVRCAEFWKPGLELEWAYYALEDGVRRDTIATYVRSSGADIVALQEVWSYGYRNWIKNTLSDAYPYSYCFESFCDSTYGLNKIDNNLITCIDFWGLVYLPSDDYTLRYNKLGNGLVLLSKWPLQNIQHPIFPAYNCGLPGTECWADKGVLTATVNVNGVPIRIGISHALTGPDDYKSNWDTQDVGTATFQLKGEEYIFSLNNNNGRAHIRRFEDYSYFDEATQTQKHGAGWKQIYEGFWGTGGLWGIGYADVVSFELDGHPYLFWLKNSNQGRIFRINDDPATGWTQVYEGPMSSTYVPVTSFELDGHPYLFAVTDGNQGRILRINDDPCTGWSDVYEDALPLGYADITSFELDNHPYIFAHSNTNNLAHIYRINDEPWGWSDVYDGNWPAGYAAITSFELDNHPYIFTYSNATHSAHIYRINTDPCTGWSDVKYGDLVFTDYIAIKSFEMNGHPYLFAQRNCCGQNYNPCGFPLPGEANLMRINDDPCTGWEDLLQLEDIRIIRDETIVEDGPPAIMMGDFNIHRGKYGIMNELFHKAGASDAYLQVADADQDGNTCDYLNNPLNQYFSERMEDFDPANPDNVDRIDYVYVKQSGAGLELVPTDAYVDRGWTYYSAQAGANWDLSDHYPVFATFRLETGCAVRMKADFDCDRLVDFSDLAILCSAWLSEPDAAAWNLDCDISEPPDEFVDFNDYSEFARQWQTMPIHNITRDKWYEVIQAAINDANDGEEIEVAPGYYYEAIDFKGKAITLRSTKPNDPSVIAATVIKGFGHYHVVKCVTGEDANTVLAGFTITGGNANGPTDADKCGGGMFNNGSSPTVTNCTFSLNTATTNGSGMYNITNSSPTVTNCTFSDNTAYQGGGMFNDGASPTVTDCNFSNNRATCGGGIYNTNNSSPTVSNCNFSNNRATYGGGIYNITNSSPTLANCRFTGNSGSGMFNETSSPTVTNCNFNGNSSFYGGGMYNLNSSSPTVTNCTFNSNLANMYGGGMYNDDNSNPDVNDCNFNANQATENGGGMFNIENSNPVVTNCNFSGNTAHDGGGISNTNSSSPTLMDCTFTSNLADNYGGGMHNDNSSPTVTNCIFSNNSARDCGGGMLNYVSNPTVTNCTFSANWVVFDSGFGGGMENFSSSPIVTNCTFTGNTAQWGGGMDNYTVDYPPGVYSSPTVTNCIFSNNSARDWGGGMCNINAARTTVINCTFSNNTAGIDGGGMRNWINSSTTVTNCILWGDMPDEIFNKSTSTATVTYSDVQGGYSGAGNINADPLFVDAANDDLRLASAASPCVDSGANAPGLPATDLAGNPRIVDGDRNGTAIVDMGAYELQALPIHNFTQDRWYETIQMAIDDATNGDEIEVYPGTYKEAINFIGKVIRLYSTNGPNDTIIDGTGNFHVVQCVSGEGVNTILEGFTITGGNANGPEWPDDKNGGGLYCQDSSPTVVGCTFSGNTANYGGGMASCYGWPTVINCTFKSNSGEEGGGLYNFGWSPITVTNCTFISNSSEYGGGVQNDGSIAVLTNCLFIANTSTFVGGGMYNLGGIPTVTNCTFSGNSAAYQGGGMYNYSSNPTVTNCILWNDTPDEIHDYDAPSSSATVTYSDVQGGWSGTGNINLDPLFVDAIGGDLRLSSGSPCIDKGSNDGVPTGITTDLDGNPRVLDGDSNGTVIVDMGAYEYLIPPPPISTADNFEYLAMICADWLAGAEPEL